MFDDDYAYAVVCPQCGAAGADGGRVARRGVTVCRTSYGAPRNPHVGRRRAGWRLVVSGAPVVVRIA